MAQPQRQGGFDFARASTGSQILLVAAAVLFIALFLPWSGIDLGGQFAEAFGISGDISGWEVGGALSVLLGLVLLGLIVWEAMPMAGVNANVGTTSPSLVSAILGGVSGLLGLIVFLMALQGIAWGAFVGLVAVAALAYGAYLRYTESRTAPPPPPPA
jgi:hypothetical protein